MIKQIISIHYAVIAMALMIFSYSYGYADDPKKPGHTENVAKLCRELETEYKDKSSRDTERIVSIYQVFDDIYPKSTSKEKKMIVKTLKKSFDVKPFPKDFSFLITGAACLSDMGTAGCDALLKALSKKTLIIREGRDKLDANNRILVKEAIIMSIGYTKDPRALKALYKLMEEVHSRIVKAACQAIGCYGSLPLKDRKPIVEKVLKVYLRIDAEAEKGGESSDAYERLIQVEVFFNDSLQMLTYRSHESASDWQKWYSENKDKKKW